MLILYTGGNTSFNGFPFLASFVAEDSYLPRQLTRRGHRLVFSNGIIVLTAVVGAPVSSPGPRSTASSPSTPSACSPGFTMAGRRHGQVPPRRTGSRTGAGAWSINGDLRGPLGHRRPHLRRGQVHRGRLGRRRASGRSCLRRSSACTASTSTRTSSSRRAPPRPAEAPVLRRHVVIVLVDRLDLATARALQYARTLHPDELRAVHFALDPRSPASSRRSGAGSVSPGSPSTSSSAPDRRLARAALELAAETVADGADRAHHPAAPPGLRRRAGERCSTTAPPTTSPTRSASLPHVNATVVPYQLTGGWCSKRRGMAAQVGERRSRPGGPGQPTRAADRAPRPRRPSTADRRSASGAGAPSRSARPVARAGAGGRPGAVGAGPAPGRHRPTSSACWPTTRAGCSWSSRAAATSRASSRAPGWWSRAWSGPGRGARPSSTPTTSSSPGPRRGEPT